MRGDDRTGEWRGTGFLVSLSRASPFAGGYCAASFARFWELRRRLSHFHWLARRLKTSLVGGDRGLIGCPRSNEI